jgi:heterodisulfide reductase subunit A2
MTFPVSKAALVVGGGVAGMEAAHSIADMGFQAYLVEKGDKLGGQALEPGGQLPGLRLPGLSGRPDQEGGKSHPNIEVLFNSTVKDTSGFHRQFQVHRQDPQGERQLDHGVTIMATGGQPYKPEEYLYGQHNR